jgi:hypothetical protein
MKQALLMSFAFLLSLTLPAQTPAAASATMEPFTRAMDAILKDFPNNFRNISGNLILSQAEADHYSSLVMVPGSLDCHITRYHSVEDTLASWQASMFRSEEFGAASRQYTSLYGKLKGCSLQLADGSRIQVKGTWEAPLEEKPFSMSSFQLQTADPRFSEMKIDVEMVYQVTEWVININVVSKRKDSLQQGNTAGSQDE